MLFLQFVISDDESCDSEILDAVVSVVVSVLILHTGVSLCSGTTLPLKLVQNLKVYKLITKLIIL